MRVKSHQLPMTMRRATDPRMESLPGDLGGRVVVGGDIQEEDVRGGTAHRRKLTAFLKPELQRLYRLIFRMKSKHFRLLPAKV